MAASEATVVESGGREVRVSSPDRVIFPSTQRTTAITKLDVVRYYLSVGDGIMRAPDYPKMPGEPKRVQPSRDRDRSR